MQQLSILLRACLTMAAIAFAHSAAATAWQPPAGIEQIPLWPDGITIERPKIRGEERASSAPTMVAGRPWTMIENVERPTMTVFPATGPNTGAAVVVFPGGGYRVLAIDLEGTEVCDWLTPIGITCAVLKYRVPGSGPHWNEACRCGKTPRVPMALQDAQRAIGVLRERAQEWGVDPHKIGVLGFSAGGHLVAAVSNETSRRYSAVDHADTQSSRPDFAVVLYPGHMWDGHHLQTLIGDVRVSAATPPTFIVQAQDDPVDDVHESLVYYLALLKAHVSVEMHLYAHGGHAFGLRHSDQPITQWPDLLESWLRAIGVLRKLP